MAAAPGETRLDQFVLLHVTKADPPPEELAGYRADSRHYDKDLASAGAPRGIYFELTEETNIPKKKFWYPRYHGKSTAWCLQLKASSLMTNVNLFRVNSSPHQIHILATPAGSDADAWATARPLSPATVQDLITARTQTPRKRQQRKHKTVNIFWTERVDTPRSLWNEVPVWPTHYVTVSMPTELNPARHVVQISLDGKAWQTCSYDPSIYETPNCVWAEPGDTLDKLCQKYGLSVDDFENADDLGCDQVKVIHGQNYKAKRRELIAVHEDAVLREGHRAAVECQSVFDGDYSTLSQWFIDRLIEAAKAERGAEIYVSCRTESQPLPKPHTACESNIALADEQTLNAIAKETVTGIESSVRRNKTSISKVIARIREDYPDVFDSGLTQQLLSERVAAMLKVEPTPLRKQDANWCSQSDFQRAMRELQR